MKLEKDNAKQLSFPIKDGMDCLITLQSFLIGMRSNFDGENAKTKNSATTGLK